MAWSTHLAIHFKKTKHRMIYFNHRCSRSTTNHNWPKRITTFTTITTFPTYNSATTALSTTRSTAPTTFSSTSAKTQVSTRDRPVRSLELLSLNRNQYHLQRQPINLFHLPYLFNFCYIPHQHLPCKIQIDLMITICGPKISRQVIARPLHG